MSLTESLRESEEICKMLRKFEEKRNHANFFYHEVWSAVLRRCTYARLISRQLIVQCKIVTNLTWD